MGLVLILLGFFIGQATWGGKHGGDIGMLIAISLWMALSLVSYYMGDSILLYVSYGMRADMGVYPQLYNVIEEMAIAANLSFIPKVYVIPESAPNAFAVGVKPENSAIIVTSGLLSALNRDQLQGVIAHEMSHILNRDVLLMTFAGTLLGSIVLLSEVFLRGFAIFSRGPRSNSGRSSKANPIQMAFVLIALVLSVLSPILTRILYYALSRRREYLADACAVRLTRYPAGLASALEVLSEMPSRVNYASKILAPMFTVNPKGEDHRTNMFGTHPSIYERIEILKSMSQGAGFADYQKAFSKVKGRNATVMPSSMLRGDEEVPIRDPYVDEPEQVKKQKDIVGIRNIMSNEGITEEHARLIASVIESDKPDPHSTIQSEKTEDFTYQRQGEGNWETFKCPCGKIIQLSPVFSKPAMICVQCGRRIRILG